MKQFKGLATGLGSLPHKDAESALDLIFECTPHIPFWPQLPRRDPREGMVNQFSENFPFLSLAPDGLHFLSLEDQDKELEVFYEKIIANDIDYFRISEAFASGFYKFYQRLEKTDLDGIEFIKCHVTGPFTFAASIKNDSGVALLHEPVLLQAILKGLGMKASWQINKLKRFNKKLILFFDEPYLGCFGSAYTPINREDVVGHLTELTAGLKSEDVLIGLHCCGNTDWSIFTDIDTIDIISFDAVSFQERFLLYADNLESFLRRQGIICWGIVPTQEFRGDEDPDSLAKKFLDGINILGKKGLDKNLLLKQSFISPSCGLGTLDIEKSEKICRLLSQASILIRGGLEK